MRRLVLASGSSYRSALLDSTGRPFDVVVPDVDEAALQRHLAEWGPERTALVIARRKAEAVALSSTWPPGTVLVAADQIGHVDEDGTPTLVTKPADLADARRTLRRHRGREVFLTNGVVVLDNDYQTVVAATDRHTIEMAASTDEQIDDYVERARPLDCVGGCRIEDDSGLIARVTGTGTDGVMGLPLNLLRELLISLLGSEPRWGEWGPEGSPTP